MPARRFDAATADPKSAEPWELERIVPLSEAVRISNLSEDTWRRRHADKLVRLSPRRLGVRLRHALMLPERA
jgi:hypothetical protein